MAELDAPVNSFDDRIGPPEERLREGHADRLGGSRHVARGAGRDCFLRMVAFPLMAEGPVDPMPAFGKRAVAAEWRIWAQSGRHGGQP